MAVNIKNNISVDEMLCHVLDFRRIVPLSDDDCGEEGGRRFLAEDDHNVHGPHLDGW